MFSNLVELINSHQATPKQDCLAWLQSDGLKSADPAEKAMVALCLGLLEYDKGTSKETR